MKRLIMTGVMVFSAMGLFSFTEEANKNTTIASHYNDKFNGRKTASGEIFSNSKLTAANKTLPFGTKVKITNIKNGKSVVVRINDRGPFVKGRAFDLSKAAFSEIANIKSGVIPVKYEIVK